MFALAQEVHPNVHGSESGERHAPAEQYVSDPLHEVSQGHATSGHGAAPAQGGANGGSNGGAKNWIDANAGDERTANLAHEIKDDWHQGDNSFTDRQALDKANELVNRERGGEERRSPNSAPQIISNGL